MGLFDWLSHRKASQSFSFSKEDEGWRALTHNNNRDLSPLQHDRMLRIAEYLDSVSGLAHVIINIPNQYIFADGFRVECKDEQKDVNTFMKHPGNQMQRIFPKRMRELRLLGETFIPFFFDQSGVMVLGYISPFAVEDIICDPHNGLFAIGVKVRVGAGKPEKYFRVYNEKAAISADGQKLAESFTDGECFYFAVNTPLYGVRGRSVLLPVMDSIDLYHKNFISESDAYQRQRGVLWDVSLRGLNNNEVMERAKDINVPTGASLRVHNESEEWKALSPAHNASNYTEFSRNQLLNILGTYSIPEHWYANGGDTNRSTAEAMSEPTKKMLKSWQDEFGHILEFIVQTAISKKKRGGSVPEVTCVWSPLTQKDNSKIASGFTMTVNGVVLAIESGLMTQETGVAMIASSAVAFGVDIHPEEELQGAQQEHQARKAEDSFEFAQ